MVDISCDYYCCVVHSGNAGRRRYSAAVADGSSAATIYTSAHVHWPGAIPTTKCHQTSFASCVRSEAFVCGCVYKVIVNDVQLQGSTAASECCFSVESGQTKIWHTAVCLLSRCLCKFCVTFMKNLVNIGCVFLKIWSRTDKCTRTDTLITLLHSPIGGRVAKLISTLI